MRERIWTASNWLSFSRMLLAIPIALLVSKNDASQRWIIAGLIFVAAMTDLFDGMLARRLNQITEFGKVIDPVADKVAIGTVCVILMIEGRLPAWFVVLIVARDLLILSGARFVQRRYHTTLQSNLVGKWAVTVIAVTILLVIFEYSGLAFIVSALLGIGAIMLVLSFALYLKRFLAVTRSAPRPAEIGRQAMTEVANDGNNN